MQRVKSTPYVARGFTLVEVLVVVALIGILATIAIAQYADHKVRAFDAAAESDLRNAMTAQEAYFSEHDRYALIGELSLATTDGVVLGERPQGRAVGFRRRGYWMTAKHINSPHTWAVQTGNGSSDDGKIYLLPGR